MAVTIPIPDADTEQRVAINHRSKRHASVVLPTDQKLAAVLLHFAPSVTQANYPALATAIKAITGINDVDLLIDGKTPVTIPAGTELRLVTDVQLRIDDIPA